MSWQDRAVSARRSRCRQLVWWALAPLLVAAVACGDAERIATQTFTPATPGTLTVATSLPAPGFWEGDDPDGLTGGLEYGLAMAMADRWDLELVVVDVPFDDLVTGDLHGADLALSQITVTDDRRGELAFSTPYYRDDDGVVMAAGEELTDLKTARERRWGAITDSTQLDLLRDVLRPDVEPETFADSVAAIDAVARGRVDAVLVDLSTALITTAGRDDLSTVARVVVNGEMAVALRSDSPNVDVVDAAIRALTSDSTIDALVADDLLPRFETAPDSLPVIRLPE